MRPVTTSVEIARSADEVFAVVADMEQNPRWQRGQAMCRWTSPPPVGVGSTYEQEARFLGRPVRSSFVVTEFVTGRRIRITSTGGTMPIDVTRTVEPLGDARCRVAARVAGGPAGLLRPLGALLRPLVQVSVRGDYARLTAWLERRSP